jgi:CRP-like cAMP-binding protein
MAELRAGEAVFEQDAPGDEMYWLVEGRVSLVRRFGTETRKLAGVGPGAFFGEMGLVRDHRRTATAIADTAIKCLCLNREELEVGLRLDPQFTRDLLVSLCDRLDRANQYLEEILRSESAYHESVQTVVQRLQSIITMHPDSGGA